MYTCDRYLILRITPDEGEPFNKLFATKAGGYLDGDSWRLNSGIVEVRDQDDYRYFVGESGSVYECRKGSYGIAGGSNHYVLDYLLARSEGKIEVLLEDPYV